MKSLMVEFGRGENQFSAMTEIVQFDTDSERHIARIYIRLDNAYQGSARVELWSGKQWNEVYTLVSPTGTYGYQESTRAVFDRDRTALLKALLLIAG